MIQNGKKIKGAKALILGITFKENCPDIRNSKVVDIYDELNQFGFSVDVYDPHANAGDVYEEYGIELCNSLSTYDAIILAVSHDEFLKLDYSMLKSDSYAIIFDTKAVLDRNMVTCRL